MVGSDPRARIAAAAKIVAAKEEREQTRCHEGYWPIVQAVFPFISDGSEEGSEEDPEQDPTPALMELVHLFWQALLEDCKGKGMASHPASRLLAYLLYRPEFYRLSGVGDAWVEDAWATLSAALENGSSDEVKLVCMFGIINAAELPQQLDGVPRALANVMLSEQWKLRKRAVQCLKSLLDRGQGTKDALKSAASGGQHGNSWDSSLLKLCHDACLDVRSKAMSTLGSAAIILRESQPSISMVRTFLGDKNAFASMSGPDINEARGQCDAAETLGHLMSILPPSMGKACFDYAPKQVLKPLRSSDERVQEATLSALGQCIKCLSEGPKEAAQALKLPWKELKRILCDPVSESSRRRALDVAEQCLLALARHTNQLCREEHFQKFLSTLCYCDSSNAHSVLRGAGLLARALSQALPYPMSSIQQQEHERGEVLPLPLLLPLSSAGVTCDVKLVTWLTDLFVGLLTLDAVTPGSTVGQHTLSGLKGLGCWCVQKQGEGQGEALRHLLDWWKELPSSLSKSWMLELNDAITTLAEGVNTVAATQIRAVLLTTSLEGEETQAHKKRRFAEASSPSSQPAAATATDARPEHENGGITETSCSKGVLGQLAALAKMVQAPDALSKATMEQLVGAQDEVAAIANQLRRELKRRVLPKP
ncbi:unnamed protein product [Chrysoparadoxa australica]